MSTQVASSPPTNGAGPAAAAAPKREHEAPETKAQEQKGDAPEVDEFGLPIRKPRRPISADDDEDTGEEAEPSKEAGDGSSGDEKKRDGVASKSSPAADPVKDGQAHDGNKTEAVADSAGQSPVDAAANANKESDLPPPKRSMKRVDLLAEATEHHQPKAVSEFSHQQLAPQLQDDEEEEVKEVEWQTMPAYAPYDIYNDDNKLVAREAPDIDDDDVISPGMGGAGKGYTRVQLDEDAQSATSMDDNTAYLFKDPGNSALDDDEDARDQLSQMQATKGLLTEGQRIAYVGIVKLAMVAMIKELECMEKTRKAKKAVELAFESMQMWSQKMIVRLYSHMEIDAAEQIMIEQLAEHGVKPEDLSQALMQNARVNNPVADDASSVVSSGRPSVSSPRLDASFESLPHHRNGSGLSIPGGVTPPLPAYEDHEGEDMPEVRTPSQLPMTKKLDIDLRWTVLCDLFLVLIADSIYDSRSRRLLEKVGEFMSVPWLEICRFEKRVTDSLEMQENSQKETWDESEHMESRKKMAKNRRLMMMGLATVGGSLVIGLSAGLLAPVIGAGLAAGFSTIGVAGTSGFLAGAGGTAIVATTGVATGGTIALRAADRRTGNVKTFEYRPLHNNKRVNPILTVAGWMNGKIDDVRLPYSTVDPVMGDVYSLLWEPEMLQSMGDTIRILATEALTQGLQQVLGSTILIALMASLQLPIVLAKLSYLIDNPWSVSVARADAAGLILADSLLARNLGARPITLVGFSLGCRVIFSCLRELANKGAVGVVQNVYMFGTPVVANKDEYLRAMTIVPGRFVNGYANNDWILGYLFRATSGGIMRVAGLAPVDVPGVENYNVTDLVAGHMQYRTAMPKLLREVGWLVESDEFTEIEDPDPENHEKRQRELINEIEEARKKLEEKPEKRAFTFWRKKKAEKKEWETYDDRLKEPIERSEPGSDANGNAGGVLFDVDAIRKEAAELASQGIEIKQLESTLPPMKLDMSSLSLPNSPANPLRKTKSVNDGGPYSRSNGSLDIPPTNGHRQGNSAPNPFTYDYDEIEHGYRRSGDGAGDESVTMSFDPPSLPSRSSLNPVSHSESGPASWSSQPAQQERPSLTSSYSLPASKAPDRNVWADEEEDEIGKEKEMTMTFA